MQPKVHQKPQANRSITGIQRWWNHGYRWLRSQDLLVLLMVLVVVLGLWGFGELADEVIEGDTRAVDEWVIQAMRSPENPSDAVGPVWFEEAVRDVTALGSTVVIALVIIAVTGFVAIRRQYHALGLILIAVMGGGLINVLLKHLFARPRPELVEPLIRVSTASFPSGHSLLSAVVYLTLGALLTRLVESMKLKLYIITSALFVSFIVGLSRVYLGVHYPTDVLAGWTVGLVWAVVCWLIADRLQKRGWVEKAKDAE
jgi:undecaprenyl-diphosphatase